jgi:small-conductance mechanosensitive channel
MDTIFNLDAASFTAIYAQTAGQTGDVLQNLLNDIVSFSLRIPAAILVLIVGWIGIGILSGIVKRVLSVARMEPTMATLIITIMRVAVWIIVWAAVLQSLGLNEIALAVSGSIALVALAIATSAKDTVGDILAGLFLVNDKDFKAGFTVKTNDVTGDIQSVDLRKTRIIGEDGKLHVIPNKDVEGKPWVVESRGGVKTK